MTIRHSLVLYKWFVYFKMIFIVIALLYKFLRFGAWAPKRRNLTSVFTVSRTRLIRAYLWLLWGFQGLLTDDRCSASVQSIRYTVKMVNCGIKNGRNHSGQSNVSLFRLPNHESYTADGDGCELARIGCRLLRGALDRTPLGGVQRSFQSPNRRIQ